ncbi:site-specific integrase, partial [Streptomyces roseolilacinus]|uniref:integrase n=1 Tax=Streptomyces roseolilacinus TaxID=66904 RepID=UPI00381784CC
MTESSALELRPPQGAVSTLRRKPRDLWPEHARRLHEHLAALYGEDDVLPTLAGSWIVNQRSDHTRRAYARGFKVFEEIAREHGVHPIAVKFALADTFRLWLEQTPTWVRVKGGRRGETARAGKPYSDASRANALSAASSFFSYWDKVSDDGVKNPFNAVQRPVIDPDFSATPGYTEQEWTKLVVTARDHHRVTAYRKRAYALLLLLYTCCLRIDSLLNARVERTRVRPRAPGAAPGEDERRRAEEEDHPARGLGHTPGLPRRPHNGWLFQTATGGQLDEPAVWRLLQSLAKRAGLPLRGPHGTKVDAITHALAKPDARPDKVQKWADHRGSRTTQRYNKRKELLDDSPGY